MKAITNYFLNAVNAMSQPVIEYKNGDFTTISWKEIENGSIPTADFSFLFPKNKDDDKQNEAKNVIIALTTIVATHKDGKYDRTDVDEMTSILFLPAVLSKDGELSVPDEKFPWIPREYLSPMTEPQLAVGNVDEYDTFFEQTTDARNNLKHWSDYLQYAENLYSYVTKDDFFSDELSCDKKSILTDGKFYLLEDDTVSSTFHIASFYRFNRNPTTETPLYEKFTNGTEEPDIPIYNSIDAEEMKKHVGQMNGQYPLSPSQREAVTCFNEISNGDILAVSGPPGTGKTTLLQSIVANMYVKAAMDQNPAPIIIATSTNNQAVTNIIDSFGKITALGIENLEDRWIEGVRSFSVFFPATTRIKNAKEKHYHYTSVRGDGFIDEMESDSNRSASKERFSKNFEQYFQVTGVNLNTCCDYIRKELLRVQHERCTCIDSLEIIKKELGSLSYSDYIAKCSSDKAQLTTKNEAIIHEIELLKAQTDDYKKRKNAWREEYNTLPWYVRLLKILPMFQTRIRSWTVDFYQENEIGLFESEIAINGIEDTYIRLIENNNQTVKQFNMQVQANQKLIEAIEKKLISLNNTIDYIRNYLVSLSKYKIDTPKDDFNETFSLQKIYEALDKVCYVAFWLAVHYYEALWLTTPYQISKNQKGKNFENVLSKQYERLAMLTPCMVMTCFMLPKQFFAYDGNEKRNFYMYNFADLLIVDEAGQISPEIGAPAFAFAKKAIVVGDEQQIAPVWGTSKALDIAMAKRNLIIQNDKDFVSLQKNGLNCSESSVMRVASLSCQFRKYKKGLFLSEHRRCYDEIIDYCNQLVYEGKLEPMRGEAKSDNENPLRDLLPATGHFQIEVASSQKNGTSRENKVEARKIAEWLRKNYDTLASVYSKKYKKEIIGIITPFKKQSVLLKQCLKEIYPEKANEIAVGTVHTFQGAERRIIIFSSVYGNQDGCCFINQNKSLMNVAVSRAKDSFLVFGDVGCLTGGEKSAAMLLRNATCAEIKEDLNQSDLLSSFKS